MKINITEKEFMAISSLIDLALAAVADAESEHEYYNNGKKRTGGYSLDSKLWERVSNKYYKAKEKAKE